MSKLPLIKANNLLRFLEELGFRPVRIKGSHVRLKADDGRATTIPIHGNREIPRGLLRKIIREDLQMELDEFLEKYYEFSGNP